MRQSDEQEQSAGEREHEPGVFHVSQTYADDQPDERRARRQEIKRQSAPEGHAGLDEYGEISWNDK